MTRGMAAMKTGPARIAAIRSPVDRPGSHCRRHWRAVAVKPASARSWDAQATDAARPPMSQTSTSAATRRASRRREISDRRLAGRSISTHMLPGQLARGEYRAEARSAWPAFADSVGCGAQWGVFRQSWVQDHARNGWWRASPLPIEIGLHVVTRLAAWRAHGAAAGACGDTASARDSTGRPSQGPPARPMTTVRRAGSACESATRDELA